MCRFAKPQPVGNSSEGSIPYPSATLHNMNQETTAYNFKLKVLTLEVFDLNISATASSKAIAAGTVFAIGLFMLIGAFSGTLIDLVKAI